MKPYRPFITIILSLIITSCTHISSTPVQAPSPTRLDVPQGVSWLKAHAIPFDTAELNKPLTDLNFLKSVIGDARIVALGEATHGTHEFFQMKHRMLEFLVEEMGFTTFAMEAGYSQVDLINAYIQTGDGDPALLLKGLNYWVWDTQEVLDMIQWMRSYNADPAHAGKINFYGFDMQFEQLARGHVTQFIQNVDFQAALQVKDDYSCYPQLSDACMKKLQDVVDLMTGHRTDYIAVSSKAEFEKALHSARIVIQYMVISSKSIYSDLRDQFMAENVEWIVDQAGPDGKVAIWAHNGHVWMLDGSYPPMGYYLHQQYGDQMVVFGFLFYQGSFHAYGLGKQSVIQTFEIAAPPAGSYETIFHATGLPRLFLDMRAAQPNSSDQDWLFTPHSSTQVGSVYDPNNPPYFTVSLANLFDVVIYFENTSPSLLLY